MQDTNNEMNIEQLCDLWLEYIYDHVKKSTYNHYCRLVRVHIREYFKGRDIHELTFPEIQKFIQHLKKCGNTRRKCGLAPKSINDILVVLRGMMEFAQLYGYEDIKIPHIRLLRVPPKPVQVFREQDYQKLLSYASKDITLSKLGLLICMYTGIRLGEVCSLKWSDLDFEGQMLSIERTIYRTNRLEGGETPKAKTKVVIAEPKTWLSHRKIPLSKSLSPILETISCAYPDNAYVLTGTTRPMEPRTYQYQYRKHLEACGIDYINFHCIRHTFATRCVEQGCDIKSLSEMLGHASTGVTLQKYVFASYEQKKQFVDRL